MTNPDFQSEVRAALAGDTSALRFSDGFADRVMVAVATGGADEVSHALLWQTRRIVPALLAASLALVAWNLQTTRSRAESLVAAAFAVTAPEVTSTSTEAGLGLANAEVFQ